MPDSYDVVESVSAISSLSVDSNMKVQQAKIGRIVHTVAGALDAEAAKGDQANDKIITAYAQVLASAASLQKSMPVSQRLSFGLTPKELGVLAVYVLGGIILVVALPFFTPWASWKSTDLANLFLYWSGVIAVLLGAQALPQLTGKSGSASSNSSS